MDYSQYKALGDCPICERPMYEDGQSVNRHHFVPRSRGGKEQHHCHRVCHDMLHRTWTNKQLEKEFADPERIRADAQMQVFIEWVSKKDPLFYVSSAVNGSRQGKSRRY